MLGLESEIKRQRDELNQTTRAHAASGQELGESKNIINALQERVSSISAQLHARTSELQSASKELEEQRELFRVQRRETEEAKGEVNRLDSGNSALQQRLNKVEEEHALLNDASERTYRELSDERQHKDQVLSKALATEKELEAKNKELAEYLARVQDMERHISDLTLGVQSKDECLAKMVATRQNLAVEVAAMREDGDYVREQLSESGNQLQVLCAQRASARTSPRSACFRRLSQRPFLELRVLWTHFLVLRILSGAPFWEPRQRGPSPSQRGCLWLPRQMEPSHSERGCFRPYDYAPAPAAPAGGGSAGSDASCVMDKH